MSWNSTSTTRPSEPHPAASPTPPPRPPRKPSTPSPPRAWASPPGRITEPHEVADLTLYLASPLANNITGTEIIIDGSQTKTL
ncbi:SDR family oxidoreductase [Streptomyces sp. NBC_01455]|uniref:SDR family oxidoreductase n=1 Tax=Streptomyces sp. NBC_01455 TaxID=2903874 RepID=UPI002E31FEAF|nr:SDR family oxidoreductase [Streptomyces sp. NBC_01455]